MTGNTENKIRILLVDDHQLMLDGLKSLLQEKAGFEIVAAVSKGEEALKVLDTQHLDVLVADINLPGMDGVELTRQAIKKHPGVRVLALTMHNESSLINQMIAAGAWGYVIKSNNISELAEAIMTVAEGKKYLSREVQSIVMDSIFKPDDPIREVQPNVPRLTGRETEILELIAKEYSNREIADKLFISERTVETHRKNIFTKTKTKTVIGLIKYAYKHNLIGD